MNTEQRAAAPANMMNSRRTRTPDLRGCQSIRCRTPALKQLLQRKLPRRAMSAAGHALTWTTAATNHARTIPARKLTIDQRAALS